ECSQRPDDVACPRPRTRRRFKTCDLDERDIENGPDRNGAKRGGIDSRQIHLERQVAAVRVWLPVTWLWRVGVPTRLAVARHAFLPRRAKLGLESGAVSNSSKPQLAHRFPHDGVEN